MTAQEKLVRMQALRGELLIRSKQRKFYDYYPDEGPLRRELYEKHLAFFEAGTTFRERAAIAANRVGKTEGIGAYEMTCHLTGIYPDWWVGRRFKNPISAWAGGESNEAVRDIIQTKLLGPAGKEELYGTGMIPRDCLVSYTRKSHIQNGVETIFVKHASGGISDLTLKSYEQGRRKWQGTEKHVVWLDEEPPSDIYEEALTRTMTVPGEEHGGMIMATFTPMLGLSEVTMGYMPGGEVPDEREMTKFVCQIDWDDVPHLSEKAKRDLLASYHPHQREARAKGKPVRGSGVIYPVDEESVKVKDFMIPAHWKRVYALDVGWKNTAVAWLGIDPETNVGYIYSCYKQGNAQPAVHAAAVKARGSWIPGCGDAAAVNQDDGSKMLDLYRNEGLNLILADKAVETGIYDVWTELANGQLKVFSSCAEWFKEFRLYRRDEKGNIVKKDDHLMDVTRYVIRTGRSIAMQKPVVNPQLGSYSDQYNRPSAMCS